MIHYVAKGNPDDPIIVFLHGFPDFWYSWHQQLIHFASKGYYTVAIDLPGYGESSKLLETGQRRVDLVCDDLVKVIQSITTKSPNHQKIVLVGHDWGAAVSFYIAYNYPNLIEKLIILNGPHPKHFQKLLKTSLKQFTSSWYMFFFGLPCLPEYAFKSFDFYSLKMCFVNGNKSPIMNADDLIPWKYIYSQQGAITSALGYYRDNIGNAKRSQADFRIKVPMMCIWGDADFALSTELATGMAKYVDNLRLRIIEGCSHFVALEAPEKVNSYINEFLNE